MKLGPWCALATVLLLPGTGIAAQLSYISGTYIQGCGVNGLGCGPLGGVIPASQSVAFETPHHHVVNPATGILDPGTYIADTFLSVDLSQGDFHAYAATAASIDGYEAGINPGATALASAFLSIDAFDVLYFSSNTLPTGTDVTFQLTATLHSLIDSYAPSNCSNQLGEQVTYAFMSLTNYVSGRQLFPNGTFLHTSCGAGSDLMSASTTLHGTVGGFFGLHTLFRVNSLAGLAGESLRAVGLNNGAVHSILDASSTGSVFIEILTPGVTLSSDSGASYAQTAAVPEPETFLLLVPALALLARMRRRY